MFGSGKDQPWEQLVDAIKQRLLDAEKTAVRNAHLVQELERENRYLRDKMTQFETRRTLQLRIEP